MKGGIYPSRSLSSSPHTNHRFFQTWRNNEKFIQSRVAPAASKVPDLQNRPYRPQNHTDFLLPILDSSINKQIHDHFGYVLGGYEMKTPKYLFFSLCFIPVITPAATLTVGPGVTIAIRRPPLRSRSYTRKFGTGRNPHPRFSNHWIGPFPDQQQFHRPGRYRCSRLHQH